MRERRTSGWPGHWWRVDKARAQEDCKSSKVSILGLSLVVGTLQTLSGKYFSLFCIKKTGKPTLQSWCENGFVASYSLSNVFDTHSLYSNSTSATTSTTDKCLYIQVQLLVWMIWHRRDINFSLVSMHRTPWCSFRCPVVSGAKGLWTGDLFFLLSQLPASLNLPGYVGCLELATLNSDVISLYNFKHIYNMDPLKSVPCAR